MRKLALASAFILLTATASAPGKEPSHPLSQINPIDTDLNMTGFDIFNVTTFSVDDGLKIEGNQIQDSGANPILVYDDATGQWEVRNGDFNLQNNNLSAATGTNVSIRNQAKLYGGKIWVPESKDTPNYFYRKNLSETLEDGESSGEFDINLSGNDLESPDAIETDGSGSDVIEMRDTSSGTDIARFNEGGNVDVPNGGLDVSGVSELEGGIVSGGNVNLDGNQITQVNAVKSDGTDLDLYTSGSGSDAVTVYDDANDQYVARFNEGGDVEIPNGDLNASYNTVTNAGGGGSGYVNVGTGNDADPGISIVDTGDGKSGYLQLAGGGNIVLRDDNGSNALTVSNDGSQLITTGGNLSLAGNRIKEIGGLQNCGQNEFINGNGNCEVDTDTDTDNQTLQDVLAQGNKANGYNINVTGGNITSDEEICAGNQCPA